MSMGLALATIVALEPRAVRAAVNPVVDCSEDEDVTVQSFKAEADINTIVRRFGVTLELPVKATDVAQFGDFTQALDFRQSMDKVVEAQRSFDNLPAAIRKRFHNDPAEFIEYIHSSDNLQEAVDLGILDRRAVEKPAEVVAAIEGSVAT